MKDGKSIPAEASEPRDDIIIMIEDAVMDGLASALDVEPKRELGGEADDLNNTDNLAHTTVHCYKPLFTQRSAELQLVLVQKVKSSL